jgi:hypothetical protein
MISCVYSHAVAAMTLQARESCRCKSVLAAPADEYHPLSTSVPQLGLSMRMPHASMCQCSHVGHVATTCKHTLQARVCTRTLHIPTVKRIRDSSRNTCCCNRCSKRGQAPMQLFKGMKKAQRSLHNTVAAFSDTQNLLDVLHRFRMAQHP